MKKLIITESEKNRIREMYGLINEESVVNVVIENKIPITYIKDKKGKLVDNTDWDGVHAIFDSKRPEFSDNLESRVEPYLKTGKYLVTNVTISSELIGNDILTKGNVQLTPVRPGQTPHTIFATRGSIGDDYIARYDGQVSGLENRIESTYGSKNIKVFGPFDIEIKGTGVHYKQIFYAADSNTSNTQNTILPLKINLNLPATKKSLDDIYAHNKAKFKNNPNQYILTKFDLSKIGDKIEYTLEARPAPGGYQMLSFLVGEESFENVKLANEDTHDIDVFENTKKIINVLNQDTNQNQDYVVRIVGLRLKNK